MPQWPPGRLQPVPRTQQRAGAAGRGDCRGRLRVCQALGCFIPRRVCHARALGALQERPLVLGRPAHRVSHPGAVSSGRFPSKGDPKVTRVALSEPKP